MTFRKFLFRCNDYNEININELNKIKIKNPKLIIVDVRSLQEYEEGHIDGSILIPNYEIKKKAEQILKDKKDTIVLYCQNGGRSRRAAKTLVQLGYENVLNLKDGIEGM